MFDFFTQGLFFTTKELPNQPFPQSLLEELLNYLESKSLICKCSLEECIQIDHIMNKLAKRFDNEAEVIAATDSGFDLMDPVKKAQLIYQIKCQCLKKESRKYEINASDIFRTIFHGTLKIITCSKYSTLNFIPVPVLSSCTYSVPTCPASSGSQVTGISYSGETAWSYQGIHTGKFSWKTNQSKFGQLVPIV